jgi:hypothetical protein
VVGAGQPVTIESGNIKNSLEILEVIYEWSVMHVNLLERWESKKYFGFQLMTQSQSYANTLAKILSLSFPLGAPLPDNARLFSLTGLPKLDNLLNKIKHRAHEYLNLTYRYLFEKVHNSVKEQSPFLVRGQQFCPFLMNSLLTISRGQEFDIITEQDEVFTELVVEAVETLVLFIGEKEFADIIGPLAKQLIVNVGLNYMRTKKQELDEMRDDPEGFVNLSLDVCDKQKSHVIKTQGAKLVESLCDNLDGSTLFVTLFAS